MSEGQSITIIGIALGLLQALGLYWIKRMDSKVDSLVDKTAGHDTKLAVHNVRLRTVENLCGVETPAPEG